MVCLFGSFLRWATIDTDTLSRRGISFVDHRVRWETIFGIVLYTPATFVPFWDTWCALSNSVNNSSAHECLASEIVFVTAENLEALLFNIHPLASRKITKLMVSTTKRYGIMLRIWRSYSRYWRTLATMRPISVDFSKILRDPYNKKPSVDFADELDNGRKFGVDSISLLQKCSQTPKAPKMQTHSEKQIIEHSA